MRKLLSKKVKVFLKIINPGQGDSGWFVIYKEQWSQCQQVGGKFGASLVAQKVRNLPAVQGNWVSSLSWKDPLEKGMAPHSSILAWRILWTEEPLGLQSIGSHRVRQN